MSKENILFTVIGLLLGTMMGFLFANSVNQSSAISPTMATAPAANSLPSGHPSVPGAGGANGSVPEIQAAIDNARQNPNDLEAQLKAAELYYQIQRFDGALEFLKKANELQPDNYEVIVNLGNTYFDAEKYAEAEKWYLSALAKKPANLDVRTDLGLSYVLREKPDFDKAVTEFKQVLAADPNHVQALQNITVAYTKKSDSANAAQSVAKLEAVDPENKALAKLKEDIAKLK